MSSPHRRLSDDELYVFHKEFLKKVEEGEAFMADSARQHTANAEAIARIESNTEGILKLFSEGEAIISIGGKLGRLIKWMAGFGLLGGIVTWFIEHNG